MRILYLTAEQWPTFRNDITVLFGKYLPRFGIHSDLLTEQAPACVNAPAWPAGQAILCRVTNNRAAHYLVKWMHQCKALILLDVQKYDAIQVRDMTVIATVALMVAKLKRIPFYYWLSYPQSEGQIDRAMARGYSAGMRYWFPLLQGYIGKWLMYRVILPNANHVFVQSPTMMEMLASKGIPKHIMTAVPMGVDLEATEVRPQPAEDEVLKGKRVLVYLGTLDRVRQIEVLFGMMAIIKQTMPDVVLVLVGDTEDAQHRAWLKQEAQRLQVTNQVLWTGWLPMPEAWRYVARAEIGLSPFPRGFLLDMASPTKAIEYMALGIPVVMNDNPDQRQVALESTAAECVPLTAEHFSTAVMQLLQNSELQARYQALGLDYVAKNRSYAQIAQFVAQQYQQLKNNQKSVIN